MTGDCGRDPERTASARDAGPDPLGPDPLDAFATGLAEPVEARRRRSRPRGGARRSDADRAVWMRYQTALVAPYLDHRTMSASLAQGWSLVATNAVARCALARSLAGLVAKLQALGDSWVDLVPDEEGARLHGRALPPSRAAFHDLVDPVGEHDTFDPVYETFPRPSHSALRVVASIAHALSPRQVAFGAVLEAPGGVPDRLVALHCVVERWVASWWADLGDEHAGAQLAGATNSPLDARLEELWARCWPFDPDDLNTAVRAMWARIGAHSPDLLDPVSDAADQAWVAWALSCAGLG